MVVTDLVYAQHILSAKVQQLSLIGDEADADAIANAEDEPLTLWLLRKYSETFPSKPALHSSTEHIIRSTVLLGREKTICPAERCACSS